MMPAGIALVNVRGREAMSDCFYILVMTAALRAYSVIIEVEAYEGSR